MKAGGFIGGDDFAKTIWQHATQFEPTLVFPYAVYFAEAVGAPIYALPHRQFLIEKNGGGFRFEDLVGSYPDRSLRHQMLQGVRAARRRRRQQAAGSGETGPKGGHPLTLPRPWASRTSPTTS